MQPQSPNQSQPELTDFGKELVEKYATAALEEDYETLLEGIVEDDPCSVFCVSACISGAYLEDKALAREVEEALESKAGIGSFEQIVSSSSAKTLTKCRKRARAVLRYAKDL